MQEKLLGELQPILDWPCGGSHLQRHHVDVWNHHDDVAPAVGTCPPLVELAMLQRTGVA